MKLLYTRLSTKCVDEVGEKLQRAAVERGFGVLNVIDFGEGLRRHHLEFRRDCRIYEVCNPHRATGLLQNHMNVSTVLPCRISVYEEGGETIVATIRPTVLMDIFQIPDLWFVAHQVQEDLKAIIDASVA